MKTRLYTILLFAQLSFNAYSQLTETITVPAGSSFDELYSKIYNYPHFKEGVVLFKAGNTTKGRFNYNLYEGEVQFISGKGDTLNLAGKNDIKNIIIGGDTFLFNNECLQILTASPKAKLAVSKRIRFTNLQKIGAYGTANTTGSITSFNSFVFNGRINNLTVQENMVFTKTSKFYVLDNAFNSLPANKKNVLKLFPQYKNEIENYLIKNNPDFNIQKDLVAFIDYLNTI